MAVRKKVTLKDIAEHCGLAATTVSRILRDKSTYCSAAKIDLVKRIASEWDYQPNIGYNIMTGRDTNIAAIIFSQPRITQDDLSHRFYMQLTGELDSRHFASYTAIMDGDLDSQLRKIRELDERGVRYYIFIGSPAYYEEIFAFLERMKRYYAGYNCSVAPRRLMPDQAGMFFHFWCIAACRGAKNYRIAVTQRYFDNSILPRVPEMERYNFRKHLYPVQPLGVVSGNSRERYFALGTQIMSELLDKHPEVDAVAFYTDFHVFGAEKVLKELKKDRSVQLFGMGDAAASKFVDAAFVTADFDVENGVGMLLDQLETHEPWEYFLSGTVTSYNIQEENDEKG